MKKKIKTHCKKCRERETKELIEDLDGWQREIEEMYPRSKTYFGKPNF